MAGLSPLAAAPPYACSQARQRSPSCPLAVGPPARNGLPAHPDAALFAMGPAIDAADREFNAALDALVAADEVYSDKEPDGPPEPEADFSSEERQALDLFGCRREGDRGHPPALAAYYQAVAAHEQETERLKAECGVTAAHELEDATSAAVNQVRDALAETPAKTLAGLIFKARYAVPTIAPNTTKR